MTRNKKLVIGGLTLAALAAGVVGASAGRHGGWGGHMGMRGHGGHGGMMGAVCSGRAAEMADHMLVDIEYKVKPTDAQKPAFEDLKTAARAAAAKAQAGCPAKPAPTADGARPPRKTPTERLALMEAGLAAQLEAVRTVRPAADKFFATLSEDQKKQVAGGERGEGGWGRHKDRGGDGDDRGEGRGNRGWGRGGPDRGGPDRGGDAPSAPGAKPDKT
jgi:hypothetical protein